MLLRGLSWAVLTVALSGAQGPTFPAGSIPFNSIYYVTPPSWNGDRLVVGQMSVSVYSALLPQLPPPDSPNQFFSDTMIELAPGRFFTQVYVPTAAERTGDFSEFAGLLTDPVAGTPFPGGIIPTSRLPDPYAFRIKGTQAPPAALSGTGQSFPATGGSGTVGITACSACAWAASSPVDWVTLTGPSSGTANGSVSYTVAPDSGSGRSATLTIAGLPFNIQQMVAGGTVSAQYLITTVAGSGSGGWSPGDGGPATSAQFRQPNDVAVDGVGNLYIADQLNNRIHKVAAATGIIRTVAGVGTPGYSGDGGPATSAQLNVPGAVAVDGSGNIYIADNANDVIREVAAATGIITTVAGNGSQGYSGDGGPATSAQFDNLGGVAVDGSGNMYIADQGNNRIREVAAATGIITTVAGNGTLGYFGDGGPATSARLTYPQGVTLDGSGDLYIADTYDSMIRKVAAATGIITRVAGNGSAGYAGDGSPATAAMLDRPGGVAVDASGNLYIADTVNSAIRYVAAATGIITTVAGNGSVGYSGDAGPATGAQLNNPDGAALDAAGNVYVADTGNNVIRMLVPAATHALLSITSNHSAGFAQGVARVTYWLEVSNTTGAGPTSGTVTVTEIVPTGLTLVSMSGTGWNCSGNICTRNDALGSGTSYPVITATLDGAADAPSLVTSRGSVSGGGSITATVGDLTAIPSGPPTAPVLVSPANGAAAVLLAPTLSWNASSGATSYDVYLGTSSSPPQVTNTTGTSYAPATLSLDTTYYWQIVALNGAGSASSATWSFTTGAALAPLQFVPVAPCRVADTRNPAGPFGGPTMTAGLVRSFAIPQSGCGIPSTAQAYSLNVTVVPEGRLGYLTLWPAGPLPLVSTLNSWGGIVVANAALVPAGSGGAVNVFVSDQTDVILDINGYFQSTGVANVSSFYAATPCRVADTRGATGQFGGPSMFGGQTRDFPVPLSSCEIPDTATAYSLNVTVVPDTDFLGYLTIWPTGSSQPLVSTLNSWTGKVVANAAIVPAGNNGSISVFVTDPTDVILDINGYFGAPGAAGALSFYPVAPCRVADTRGATGAFGGPEMGAGETRSFAIPAGACNIPSNAAAYSLNVTVVPDGALSYLSAWPAGSTQPLVSTLNSFDGSVVANAAVVPAGTNGAISVFVTNPTHVILDINGYFAP